MWNFKFLQYISVQFRGMSRNFFGEGAGFESWHFMTFFELLLFLRLVLVYKKYGGGVDPENESNQGYVPGPIATEYLILKNTYCKASAC